MEKLDPKKQKRWIRIKGGDLGRIYSAGCRVSGIPLPVIFGWGKMNGGQRWCIIVQNKSFFYRSIQAWKSQSCHKEHKTWVWIFLFSSLHSPGDWQLFIKELSVFFSETWFMMASSTFTPEVQVKILIELWLHPLTQCNCLYIEEITFQDERSGWNQDWKCLDLTRVNRFLSTCFQV